MKQYAQKSQHKDSMTLKELKAIKMKMRINLSIYTMLVLVTSLSYKNSFTDGFKFLCLTG